MSVSALAQTLKGSEIIKIGGEINELKKKGEKIANPGCYATAVALEKEARENCQFNYRRF